MTRLSPTEAAEKYVRRGTQAGPDYIAGVRRVRVAPGQAAAAKQDKMLMGVTEAVQSGRWAERTAAVSLQSWQQAAERKGGVRYGQGIQEAQAKVTNAFQKLFPLIDQVSGEVNSMPDLTVEQRVAKSSAFQLGLHRATRGQR